MPNTLGVYDPIFYAQEALQQLEMALGMAGRVHRGLEQDPQAHRSTIQIRRPSTFVSQAMPASAQDLDTETITVLLDQWEGVVFSLTDKELTYTRQRIIDEHIRPAAVAVATSIDLSLCKLALGIPWYFAGTATPTDVSDITALWQQLFDNKVPQEDWHLMLNGERTAKFMNLAAFSQWQGAGAAGVNTQLRGALGEKFGFEIFSNQNVYTHTTTALGSVTQLQLNANVAKNATTVVLKDSDGVLTGTIAKGDSFVIAGNTQRYVATANATASGNLFTVSIAPRAVQAYSTNDNVTLHQPNGKKLNLAFHRNAFALGMAPLSELGNGRGAEIRTVADPISNLALRARLWYDGDNAKLNVGIDALWGVKVLNENMAVNYES